MSCTMLGILATTLATCMLVVTCGGQSLVFEAIPDDCRQFQFTFFDYTSTFPCPDGTAFSTFINRCVPEFSYLNNQCPQFQCQADIAAICRQCLEERSTEECIYAYNANCASYINCTKFEDNIFDNLPAFIDECVYPNLYSAMSRRCEDFVKVKCGRREEPREPCQYERNHCGRSAHCKPCAYRFPSCTNKPDGIQPWDGRSWTPYFAECKGQRTLNSGQCPSSRNGRPRIFSVTTNRCDDLEVIPRQYGGLSDDN